MGAAESMGPCRYKVNKCSAPVFCNSLGSRIEYQELISSQLKEYGNGKERGSEREAEAYAEEG